MNNDSTPMPLDDMPSIREAHRKLEEGHREIRKQIATVAADLKINTETTKRIEANTADLIETFSALQGGFKVLTWLVKAAIPLALLWGGFKAYTLGIFK